MAGSNSRIPTLDGWRGVGILLVLVAHLQTGLWRHTWHSLPWLDTGKHGVTIFFVLSGYLITTLLRRRDGDLRLGEFYVRRLFRLGPVAAVYLVGVALLGVVVRQRIIGGDAWACVLMMRNYLFVETPHNAFTSHFWSLSIEEQFYLVWPAMLLLLRRRALALAIAGAAGVACFRYLHWSTAMGQATRTELRVDALLVGCALAMLVERESVRRWFERHAVWLFCVGAAVFAWDEVRFQVLMPLTESVAIAAMLGATSLRPGMAASRVLEWRPLQTLGVLSYSLYMWQELFLLPHTGPVGPLLLPIAAIVSWRCVEEPMRRYGAELLERRRLPEEGPAGSVILSA